jgi:hypothetical protein
VADHTLFLLWTIGLRRGWQGCGGKRGHDNTPTFRRLCAYSILRRTLIRLCICNTKYVRTNFVFCAVVHADDCVRLAAGREEGGAGGLAAGGWGEGSAEVLSV